MGERANFESHYMHFWRISKLFSNAPCKLRVKIIVYTHTYAPVAAALSGWLKEGKGGKEGGGREEEGVEHPTEKLIMIIIIIIAHANFTLTE